MKRWLPVFLGRLGTRTLTVIFAVLFVVNLLIPDPVPFIDELLLGAGTLLAARWRRRSPDAGDSTASVARR
jgi:uncharacterized protein DUF6116